mmetsp:Transcript_5666/g.25569  ORF Transcript_5666/g.25569 Transcript_5666/m.25569 type:complete len:255 (+) Transcript_5666:2-766(+)
MNFHVFLQLYNLVAGVLIDPLSVPEATHGRVPVLSPGPPAVIRGHELRKLGQQGRHDRAGNHGEGAAEEKRRRHRQRPRHLHPHHQPRVASKLPTGRTRRTLLHVRVSIAVSVHVRVLGHDDVLSFRTRRARPVFVLLLLVLVVVVHHHHPYPSRAIVRLGYALVYRLPRQHVFQLEFEPGVEVRLPERGAVTDELNLLPGGVNLGGEQDRGRELLEYLPGAAVGTVLLDHLAHRHGEPERGRALPAHELRVQE